MKAILFFLLVFFSALVHAQDPHFTQYYVAPILINPAHTGALNGDFRLAAGYRNQWFANFDKPDKPYNSFFAAFDSKFDIKNKNFKYDKLGVGVNVTHQSAGVNTLQYNNVMLSVAYHKALDRNARKLLTAGLQMGMLNLNANFSNLTFEDQFNGIDGFNIPTNEQLPANSTTVGDIGFGIMYAYQPSNTAGFFLGGSINHLTKPDIGLYLEAPDPVLLDRRYSVQAGAQFYIKDNLVLIPRGLATIRGSLIEGHIGANLGLHTSSYSSNKFIFGGWMRITGDTDTKLTVDALSPVVGYDYEGMKVMVSYDGAPFDYTVKNITPRSALELTISYTINADSKGVFCPNF